MSEQDLSHVLPPTSRFQLYPSPLVTPGKCAVCGAVDRPVVDFGMTLQFYGAVLLCVTCLTEAGAAIGLVPQTEVAKAEGLAQTTFEEQLASRDMKAIPNELVGTLDMAFGALSSVIFSLMSGDPNLVAGQTSESNDVNSDDAQVNAGSIDGSSETTDGTSREVESRDAGSSEQDNNTTSNERPVSVSSGSGDGDKFFDL